MLYASQEVFLKHAEDHSVDIDALLTLQRECVEERAFALGIHPDHLAAALADLRLFAAESDPSTSPLLDSVTRRAPPAASGPCSGPDQHPLSL